MNRWRRSGSGRYAAPPSDRPSAASAGGLFRHRQVCRTPGLQRPAANRSPAPPDSRERLVSQVWLANSDPGARSRWCRPRHPALAPQPWPGPAAERAASALDRGSLLHPRRSPAPGGGWPPAPAGGGGPAKPKPAATSANRICSHPPIAWLILGPIDLIQRHGSKLQDPAAEPVARGCGSRFAAERGPGSGASPSRGGLR